MGKGDSPQNTAVKLAYKIRVESFHMWVSTRIFFHTFIVNWYYIQCHQVIYCHSMHIIIMYME